MTSVQITSSNPALETLPRSWNTAIYSDEDGIGQMGSLHEAGDALVALAVLDEAGTTILGSGVMIGPGLVLAATHVLDEFKAQDKEPVLLTFLPDGTRAWLPYASSSVSGKSEFDPNRKITSDLSLLSCTLNSEAHEHRPLTLTPLHISLPLIGERLWAFGYRHAALKGSAAMIAPLVSSGLVTAVFPQGRGERMPSSCIEVEMDTRGGMSGGPVVNANGYLVGIVSSSFEGGPSYVTLIWEALRIEFSTRLPSLAHWGDINLIAARELGLVKLKGQVKRSRSGNTTITLTEAEGSLMAVSSDASAIQLPSPGSELLVGEELDDFVERWLPLVEKAAEAATMAHLEQLNLSLVRRFLAATDIPEIYLKPITGFSVEDFEGLEDPDIQSARLNKGGTATIDFAFDLLTVIWTIELPTENYLEFATEYDTHFLNSAVGGPTTKMELFQRCHFEATLTLDLDAEEFTQVSITFSGVFQPRPLRLNNRSPANSQDLHKSGSTQPKV